MDAEKLLLLLAQKQAQTGISAAFQGDRLAAFQHGLDVSRDLLKELLMTQEPKSEE